MTRNKELKLLAKEAFVEMSDFPSGAYPTSLAGRWLFIAYPEIAREFMKWYDEKVRREQ